MSASTMSQLLCLRCGHSEDEHNWGRAGCCHKDGTTAFYPFYETHCTCYAFVSKFDVLRLPEEVIMSAAREVLQRDVAWSELEHMSRQDWTCMFILLHAEGRI